MIPAFRSLSRALSLAVLGAALCFPAVAGAAAPAKSGNAIAQATVTEVPLVRLKHWRDSTDQERYGFLVGFVTALEMEREWQGAKPLPLQQSLNGNWIKGLYGVTLKDMNDNLNAYIAANPDDLNRPVVEYLWFTYVQPKVTETISPAKLERVTKDLNEKKKGKK